jgi:menaquinone-dependent protoporphyrinogen oxidase
MTQTVLVTYASKHNSTAEIADTIGAVLQKLGVREVDIRPVDLVEDLTPYSIVVLGSAVYAGQWQSSAANFLKRHEQELTQRMVWLFSSGPTGKGDPSTLMKDWKFPQALEPVIARIQPQGIALFHGKLAPADLTYLERLLVKGIHAPIGDYRDWDMIRDWAAEIARTVMQKA